MLEHPSKLPPPPRCVTAANSVYSDFEVFRTKVSHSYLIFLLVHYYVSKLIIEVYFCFVCVCFICALLSFVIRVCTLCFFCNSPGIWLLNQHYNKQELN
jgi:hypothetical protein